MKSENSVVYDAYPKVSIKEFIPELAFEFEDASEEIFSHFILKAINRFARDSNALVRDQDILAQCGACAYKLEALDCVDVVGILRVTRESDRICGEVDVPRINNRPGKHCCFTQRSVSWFEAPDIIHFNPCSPPDVFHVLFSVAPKYDACEVDRILLDVYLETILDGSRYFLYNMQSKPWSQVQRAQECYFKFLDGIKRASVESHTGGQRGVFKRKTERIF